jgi:hypothetical protein
MPGYIEFSNFQPANMFIPLQPTFKKPSGNTNILTMRSVFSNNAAVYYKPHTLSIGGVGTVRNNRHKGNHT